MGASCRFLFDAPSPPDYLPDVTVWRNQYDGFFRKCSRGRSVLALKIFNDRRDRIGFDMVSDRTDYYVNFPSYMIVQRRMLSEFGISVVPTPDGSIRKMFLVERIEEPDVEVFHPVAAIAKVKRRALAEGNRYRVFDVVQFQPLRTLSVKEKRLQPLLTAFK